MKRVIALLLMMVAPAGCSDDGNVVVRGSGSVITEVRQVSGFDEISILGFGDARVEIGPAETLSVEAEDNVIGHLITEVKGGTLVIRSEEGISLREVEEPVYVITMPGLAGVSISGSGKLTAAPVQADSFEIDIAGSGDVTLAGSSGSLDVSIEGSGGVRGEELVTADATVRIAGSGSVLVSATENLDVTISGSGNVTYFGDPAVTRSISGSGSIERG